MTDKEHTFRYWAVNCLGCHNPIPLYAEPVGTSASTAHSTADSGFAEERPFFRAWCVECGREYPYLSEAMTWTHEPPLDKHNRQLEFTRLRHRARAKAASA
jgi:hypothetical protein